MAPDSENEIDATLDLILPGDVSDELLVVRFKRNMDIYDISHES
ncbi:DUF2004 domain-containing protein [Listeria sp. ILCC797]